MPPTTLIPSPDLVAETCTNRSLESSICPVDFFVPLAQPPPSDTWCESNIFTATAEDILHNRFSFYGESHQLPEHIDWEHNPGTAHWIVDLNRFPFLDQLCTAYQKSNDVRYLRKAVELILSWINQSGGMQEAAESVMCRSYLNVAIHLCYWVKTLALIKREAPELISTAGWNSICESIQLQVEWLDRKIPTHASNWVFIGCRGILVTAAYCPGLKNRDSLIHRAWQRISTALNDQVLPDGVHDEMTPHYHAAVIAQIISCLDHQTPAQQSKEIDNIQATLGRMLRYLTYTLTPEGQHLAFNDADADYTPRVKELINHPIGVRALADDQDQLMSRCFPFAGTMFLRQGSSHGENELYVAFDGGSFGMNHGHEDKLSFWLSALGRAFLVDPGRHLYDQSEQSFRNFLNSTQAHSTICIDGYGQRSRDLPESPGAWRSNQEQPILWDESNPDYQLAGGFYDLGYGPRALDIVHYRLIAFFPKLLCYGVADLLDGSGLHLIESRLQFAPGELKEKDGCLQTSYPDANLAVVFQEDHWDALRIECGATNPRGGWYSSGYNKLQPAPCAVFSRTTGHFPFVSQFTLLPFIGKSPCPDSTRQASSTMGNLMHRGFEQLKCFRARKKR
jgi:hypothetical protein